MSDTPQDPGKQQPLGKHRCEPYGHNEIWMASGLGSTDVVIHLRADRGALRQRVKELEEERAEYVFRMGRHRCAIKSLLHSPSQKSVEEAKELLVVLDRVLENATREEPTNV